MKIVLQLVTWNSAPYLSAFFASMRQLELPTGAECVLHVLDNASTDDTLAVLRAELAILPFPYELVISESNSGFSGGHNRLLAQARDAEYVVFLNPDLVLTAPSLRALVAYMESAPHVAMAAPRLMRGHSDTIDALGLAVYRNRRVVDIGAGLPVASYKPARGVDSVFGVSGACFIARVSALRSIAFADGTIFDELYGSYKEDVDLAWRLQSTGSRAAVLFDVIVYHTRGSKSVSDQRDIAAHYNKRTQPDHVRYLSYRNHLMTIYKNEYWQNFLLDAPWILWYEGKKFVYNLLLDRKTLKAIGDLWKHRRELRAKRAWIQSKRTVSWQSLRHFWRRTWTDQSFGVIVARRDGAVLRYLVIKQQDGAWQFPKGHPNLGETLEETARRELMEETGVTPERILDVPPITIAYTFQSGEDTIHKRVGYLLATTTTPDMHIDEVEVLSGVWLTYDEALAQLSYSDHRRILGEAKDIFETVL